MTIEVNNRMSVYVGTYGKYNRGSIAGDWLHLDNYENWDEFMSACASLHKDEFDPEFMFQVSENIPSAWFSEDNIDSQLWEMLEDQKQGFDLSAFVEYLDVIGSTSQSYHELKEQYEDRYCGQWGSFREFTDHLFDETVLCHYGGGSQQEEELLTRYFNFDSWENDNEADYFITVSGYVFRN